VIQSQLMSEFLPKIETFWQFLPDKPEETPSGALHALWLMAAGEPCSVVAAQKNALPELTETQISNLSNLIERRRSGEPLAHILGRQEFMGLELLSGPDALIPRKETELLGYKALSLLKAIVSERGDAKILDLCTGSGNLAVALACHEKQCTIIAADISEAALALARKNAEFQNVSPQIEFRQGDLFDPIASKEFLNCFDLVVCNPPYISSAKVEKLAPEVGRFEPHAAFDGGVFGLGILGRLIVEAPDYLKPRSWLCFEVGVGQGAYLAKCLKNSNRYGEVESLSDANNQIRVLIGKTP
jgi:release factor glutamine methyltransferase